MWEFTNRNFVDFDSGAVDFEALGREEYEFRKAMFFKNFKNSERAKIAFEEADKDYKKNVSNGSKGGRPRKDGEQGGNQSHPPAPAGMLTYGRFENVKLSQQQFSELAVKIGNVNELNSMIDSLSCKVEDGSAKSDNHYATLIHWIDYRREHPSPSKNTNATVSAVANAQDETSRRLAMIRKLGR